MQIWSKGRFFAPFGFCNIAGSSFDARFTAGKCDSSEADKISPT